MGTLTEQPRHLRTSITENIDGDIATMVDLAKKHGISVSDVIAVADMLDGSISYTLITVISLTCT